MYLPFELIVVVLSLQPSRSAAFHIPWTRYVPFFPRDDARRLASSYRQHQQDLSLVQGVRKMSIDEGEMFFPNYWTPHGQPGLGGRGEEREAWWTSSLDDDEEDVAEQSFELHEGNSSIMLPPAQAPYAVHELSTPDNSLDHFLHLHLLLPRALRKREFQCPKDTTACTDIDRPNSCCQPGYNCKSLTGSSSGDVGCCAEGEDCGTAISDCASDQTPCPADQGGGCCLPGYTCAGVGCAAASTAVVTINPIVTASPSAPPTTASSTTSSSVSVSVSTAATTSTAVATSSSSTIITTTTKTSPPPVAPVVRATSGSAASILTTTGQTTTYTPTSCPTGFYACNAHYLGGCCRIGRDCSSTSCPAPPSSLVLSSNGVSIGVAADATKRLGKDGCALGWFRCDGGEEGGGCCPSGFACGESCTATSVNLGGGVTGTAKVAKDNGNSASKTVGSKAWTWGLQAVAGFISVSGLMT